MHINNLGHMTKMAAMPKCGKTLQKSFSLEPMGRYQQNLTCIIGDLEFYNVYINFDPVMTLTYKVNRGCPCI